MNPRKSEKSDKSDKQLDLIQVNESISILYFKLQIIGERLSEQDNQYLLSETLDELARMYSIRKNLIMELYS